MEIYNQLMEEARKARKAMVAAQTYVPDDVARENMILFDPWVAEGKGYKKNDRVRHNDQLWRCLTDHTSQSSWEPGKAPSLWVLTDDPAEEWPEWRQPQGAHDAYAMGAKVSHNGKHWVSNTDNNVWEPGVSGWDEQKEE